MPNKREIIYPIFLECCEFITNRFWETIFEDLAYGKTPYGTYISKNFLCCSYKNKEFSYKIERNNPKKIYKDIYNLLVNKLGLLSQQEKNKKRLDFYEMEENIKETRQSWTSIRKKNVKDILIEKYVVRMRKKYYLTIKQSKYLLSLIFISMIFKAITTKDIIYEDGKIMEIQGIDFAKNKILLERDIYKIEVSFAPQIVIDKKSMSDSWEKYLKELRKLV